MRGPDHASLDRAIGSDDVEGVPPFDLADEVGQPLPVRRPGELNDGWGGLRPRCPSRPARRGGDQHDSDRSERDPHD
jgi:hypothetical protein